MTPSRTEAVLDAIKHAILTGDLSPGQALVETELAERLGVSKTPVREALKTLAGTGLVRMLLYKGATVCEVTRSWRGRFMTCDCCLSRSRRPARSRRG